MKNEISKLSNRALKDEAQKYHDIVVKLECNGHKDLLIYSSLLKELTKREISVRSRLLFK